MSELRIREATIDDLATIVDFNIRMADETEDIELDSVTVTAGVRAVLEDGTKGTFYVADIGDGSPVRGQLMITYEWSDWRNGLFLWIQSVFVDVPYRRQGVFRALYRHVEARGRTPGHCGVRLYVHDHNDSAERTYLDLGMVSPGYRLLETPDSLRDQE